jgi:hypothetical protein
VYNVNREANLSCEGRRGQNWEIVKQRVVYKRSCDAVILYRYVYWREKSWDAKYVKSIELICFYIDEVSHWFYLFFGFLFKVTVDPDCAIAHRHYFDVFSSDPLSKTLCRNSWGKTFTDWYLCIYLLCILRYFDDYFLIFLMCN